MPGSTPLVTVGLPLYNAVGYLDEAMAGLLNQTFADFEVLMCDNASTDGTLERCHYWASRDGRVVVLPSEINRGAAWNYNRAVEAASGKYFRWHAHDDRCDAALLERLIERFRSDPNISLAYSYTRVIDENGDETRLIDDELGVNSESPANRGHMLLRNLRLCNAVFGLTETSLLRTTSMIGAYAGSDRTLLFELALRGPFAAVPEYLFERRLHSGSSLRVNQDKRSIETWFDTSATSKPRSPGLRLFCAHMAAALQIPMSVKQRLVAVPMVCLQWPIARARFLKRRAKRRRIQRRSASSAS